MTHSVAAEAAYHEQVQGDLSRNYAGVLAHGMLGMTGFRLVTAPTFVPAYIFLLSASRLAVGVALSAQFIGMALSSIWGATLIEHRRKVMPVVYSVGWLMRLQILWLALSGYFLSGHAALTAACIFLGLFGFFSGMQNVSFSFMMSKVIPVNRRGQLTGMRNFLGGLIASGVAYLGGKYLVAANTWGNGYATTFLAAFVFTSLGITALNFVREPESLAVRLQSGLLGRLREVPAMLRADEHYRRFFFARALGALGTTAVPFYAIYAGQSVHLSGAMLAYLSLAFLLSQTVSNLAWGPIADRHGYRRVFIISMGLWTLSTAALVIAGGVPSILLAFCGLGSGFGGYQVASQNFVLEFGKPHDRPMLIAVSDTASHLMMASGPLLGGYVAQQFDFGSMFAIAIFVMALSVLAILRVQEPRHAIEQE